MLHSFSVDYTPSLHPVSRLSPGEHERKYTTTLDRSFQKDRKESHVNECRGVIWRKPGWGGSKDSALSDRQLTPLALDRREMEGYKAQIDNHWSHPKHWRIGWQEGSAERGKGGNKTEIGSSRPCQRPNRRRRRVTRKLDCEDWKIQSFPFITFVDTPSEACRPRGQRKKRVSLRAPNSKYQSKTSKCLRHIEKPVNRSLGSCRRMEGDSLV